MGLTAVRDQAQHPGFTMKLLVVFLELLVVLGMSQGAVMDLLNLVRRYEDEILGRRVGYPGIKSNNNYLEDMEEEKDNVGKPIEVHGWGDNLKLGQVSAVDVNLDDDPVIFQRGPVTWDEKSFDRENVLQEKKVIAEDTIITLDADTGKVKSSFGSGLFYMPHGLSVDHGGNTWVTDVGLHQVMMFSKGATTPSLVLGEKFIPGEDANHFCKPTSVAVSSSGQVFVADGYCNNREGKTVECVGAGLHSPQFLGQSSSVIQNLGRVYAIAGRGAALLAVTVQGSYYDPPTKGVTLDLADDNQVVDTWGEDLVSPHDVTVARAGDAVYVVEIAPNAVRKFEVVTPAAEMF